MKHTLHALAAAGLLALVGCGGSTSVSGTVTYDGQPIDDGYINFVPADGQGPTAGAPIKQGQYQASELVPGKKIVEVIGIRPVDFATSSAEMARRAQEQGRDLSKLHVLDSADDVPKNAVGNNEVHEVKPGQQTLDLDLKQPTAGNG